ncbi:AraC family transcriptional regulator [Flavivirga spongiicola]|uniref:AraC family transcriptional regulator n=1 Tax=Flavivirga spongiicola TaxID=421621 RepID=A0ABU7XNP5_9FLAO|nr:AraC family transcriptional regulator [Flavivirga sp. MEBiC05379]MDO5977390.1 AraC family transcriptional regulator [Flavivirga sp. MEBiC05379]
MKLHLLDRSSLENNSFTIKKNNHPYFLKVWHYHPELELVIILKSTGTRFIGDDIDKFQEGDVVLVGKNLPHMLLNDDEYFNASSNLRAEAIAVHFKKEFLGFDFFNTPEMKHISDLFERANQGIKFNAIGTDIIEDIEQIFTLNDFDRTMKLINILNVLAKHKDYHLLSSIGFVNSFGKSESKDLDKIYEYIFKNFTKEITLKDVADIAKMNPSSFSRLFKRINRKTFKRYLNEIRIGYACKLLMEKKYNISYVCYESGFNNISNFNRQFKIITKMPPSQYISKHLN